MISTLVDYFMPDCL